MAGKQKSDKELCDYLEKHLSYERDMLGFTAPLLMSATGLDWCVMFEGFGLHARNIHDFLRNEGSASTTFRACDYVNDYKARDNSNIKEKMNQSFFRLSSNRLKDSPVNLQDISELGSWIDRNWADWASQLREPFSKFVDISPVCGQLGKPTPSATNHFIVSTLAPGSVAFSDDAVSITFSSKVEI